MMDDIALTNTERAKTISTAGDFNDRQEAYAPGHIN